MNFSFAGLKHIHSQTNLVKCIQNPNAFINFQNSSAYHYLDIHAKKSIIKVNIWSRNKWVIPKNKKSSKFKDTDCNDNGFRPVLYIFTNTRRENVDRNFPSKPPFSFIYIYIYQCDGETSCYFICAFGRYLAHICATLSIYSGTIVIWMKAWIQAILLGYYMHFFPAPKLPLLVTVEHHSIWKI